VKRSYLVAVDVGVSFVKAGLYDVDGNPLSLSIKPARGEYPEPGVFLQKNQDYLATVLASIKEAVDQSGVEGAGVAAVGLSCALGGATGVDRNWNVIFDWSIISDTRYYPWVTRMKEEAGPEILRLSGTNFPIFAPKLLWWKHEYPERYRKVHKFMFLCGYLAGTLCGLPIEEAHVDRTHLQISSLADLAVERWSEDICGRFGIDTALLPRILDSYAPVGKLQPEYARVCGLPSGTPFVAGTGDKPAGSIGAGLVDPGILVDESASFGALSLCVDSCVPDERFGTLENMPSPIRGYYNPCIFLFGSGVTHAWFRDNFALAEKAQADREGVSAFHILDEAARSVPPGSEGLLALGLLGGRGYPSDPDIRGMWIGHTWSHKTAHFYRALLESFAYEYAYVLGVMKSTYPDLKLEEVRVIGGGARSDFWNQLKADVMGLKYVRLNRDDLALLGDVVIAGHGVGIYEDLKTVRRFVQTTDMFEPDMETHLRYRPYVGYYAQIFDRTRGIFQDLQEMQKPPGGQNKGKEG
jgi:xylulokinase